MVAKVGDIVEFKRKGFVSWLLGGLLKLFERDWDQYGWHLAIVWHRGAGGWHLLESTAKGVSVNFYPIGYLKANTRVYRWLKAIPSQKEQDKFYAEHKDKQYDAAVYFWTMAQYLFRHFVHIVLPLVLDDRYSCWELADEWCDEMGKSWAPTYGFPMINDFRRKAKDCEVRWT